jgi:hypothetical protein
MIHALPLAIPFLLAISLAACAQEPLQQGSDDKSDAVDRLCLDEGLEPGCDICAVRELHNDGICDDFCVSPDPDCGESGQCRIAGLGGFEQSSDFGDELVISSEQITADNIDAQSEARVAHFLAAAEFATESSVTLENVFDVSDDGTFEVLLGDVVIGDSLIDFTWYKWFAGDTEVGVIFDVDTITVLAAVSDGQVRSCELAEAE